jgi:serine/threonine-protein kinase SRPK3
MRKVRTTSSTILSSINYLHLGTLLHTNSNFTPSTLEDILRGLEAVDEGEIPSTAAFLRRCLSLDPKLRPSAQELLKDSWLN